MAHTSIVNRSRILATATALSAAGLLVNPAPAQASPTLPLAPPPCTQYEFNGPTGLEQSNRYEVDFSSKGPIASGLATSYSLRYGADGAPPNSGTISGGIQGRDIDLTVRFNGGGRGRYTGKVGDDGFAFGVTVDENNPSSRATWRSVSNRLVCAKPQPAPPPPDVPPAPAQTPKPAELGAIATGPATLQAGLSGTYVVTVSNKGGVPSAPVDLLILFAGKLEQTGQIAAGGGFCELRGPDAGINAAVRCTGPQLEPGAKVDFTVQGRGSTPGAGSLLARLGNDVNQKDVAIT